MTKKSSAQYRAFYEAFNKYVLTVIADWLDAGHTSLDHLSGSRGGHDGHSHRHLPPPRIEINSFNCSDTEGNRTRESVSGSARM